MRAIYHTVFVLKCIMLHGQSLNGNVRGQLYLYMHIRIYIFWEVERETSSSKEIGAKLFRLFGGCYTISTG